MSVTFTVKNVPGELAQALRERAAAHHRSLQGELLEILQAAASPPKAVTVDDLWRFAQANLPEAPGESAAMIREDRDAR